jgi:Mn-dependent DtxR family transcriptional regulator
MKCISELFIASPNDAVSKIPGRNALPRLLARGLVRYDRSYGGYVLTDLGKAHLHGAIDYQI